MERKRRWADSRRISPLDPRDLHYWSKFLGVEEHDLLVAVDKVGSSLEHVRRYLDAEGPVRWNIISGGQDNRRVAGRM
ncbi:MAG: DUF3606 domain-containing protein [Usitatibacter sp.]